MSPEPSVFSPLVTVDATGSTQDDLREDLLGGRSERWPHFSALHALSQSAGRGRSGRAWVTPPTGALTVSVVLRPLVPASALGWLPLLGGLAVRDALAPLVDPSACQVGTKWPNDVVAHCPGLPDLPGWQRHRKLAGVLAELVAPAARPAEKASSREQAAMVVLGIGVNVDQVPEELPVPWAASLRMLGARAEVGELRESVGIQLRARLEQWEEAGGRPGPDLMEELRSACTTLGRAISVQTPDGQVSGTAVDLRPELVVDTGERLVSLQAGEVSLLRTQSQPGDQ